MNNQEFKLGDVVKTNLGNMGTISDIINTKGSTFYKVEYDNADSYGNTYDRFLSDELSLINFDAPIDNATQLTIDKLNMGNNKQLLGYNIIEQEIIITFAK